MSFNEFTILIYDIIYVNLLYEYLHKVPSSYCAYRNIYLFKKCQNNLENNIVAFFLLL